MSVRHKIIEILSRRDHSQKELRLKLKKLKSYQDKGNPRFTDTEIDEGVRWAILGGWLKPSEQIAESMARSLDRKKKGIQFINSYLSQKGLPGVVEDKDNEYKKALELIKRKARSSSIDNKTKLRWHRFLLGRGFSNDVIRKVLKGVDHEES